MPSSSQGEKTVKKLGHLVFSRLSVLYRTAHAVAKHGCAYYIYCLCHVWMSALVLDEAKGLDIGQTYRNDSGCWLSLMF